MGGEALAWEIKRARTERGELMGEEALSRRIKTERTERGPLMDDSRGIKEQSRWNFS